MIRHLTEVILSRTLPEGTVGESIRADLAEELEELREEGSGTTGQWWYLWESVKLGAYFALFNWRETRSPPQPRGGGKRRGDGFMGSVEKDLRFAFRTLQRRWVFTAVAVLTLGIGIGSATAMFSVVDGVLLRSVPFQDPGRLVNVWTTAEGARGAPGLVGRTWDRLPFSLEEYRAWRAGATTFGAVAIHNGVETTLTGGGPTARITLGVGSASLLEVLGVQPLLGRWFLPDEEGDGTIQAADVTVVSYETWVGRLGADPEILGKTLNLSGTPHTVIGVLPSGFRLRYLGMHWLGEDTRGFREVWVPVGGGVMGNGNNLEAIGRLAPGVDIQAAAAETLRILKETGYHEVVRIVPRSEDETHALASPLVLLLAATGVLLLIGCANISTLTLGELQSRGPELSTRSALGAGGARIVRQLLTESLVVGSGGTVLGVVIAFGATRALVAMAPPLPRVETVGVDLRVLVFAALLGIAASILFGTVPAIASASRSAGGMAATTRTASIRRSLLERWMVSAEIALTVVLLVAGGLLARSFQRLLAVDPGFDPRGLATVSVYLPGETFQAMEALPPVYDELVAAIRDIPGVTEATAITRLPFPGLTNTNTLRVLGRNGGEDFTMNAQQLYALPGYHETMGIPVVAGDGLTEDQSRDSVPEILLSENIARKFWPEGSAVGARVRLWGQEGRVVGIVGSVKRNALGADPDPAWYASLKDRPNRSISLVARTSGNPAALATRMRETVQSLYPDVPVRQVTTLPDLIFESAAQERYRTFLMGVFSLVATLLAAVGIGGVTARGIAHRKKELGIRICLGAGEDGLLKKVVGEGLLNGAAGTTFGLLVALGAGRLLGSLLFEVTPFDLPTYALVAGFLLLVVVIASYLPARRIAGLDPARILRAE